MQRVRGPGLFGPKSHVIDAGTIECGGMHFPRESAVEWTAEATPPGPNRVDFSIRLTNSGKSIIRKAGAAVCLRFLRPAFWCEENAYVLSDDRIASLSQLGRKAGIAPDFEAYLLWGVSFPNVFYEEFWGFNPRELDKPMIVSHDPESGWSVAITGEHAYFMHSNKGGPCTDIMLAFDDMPPAASTEEHGSVLFQRTKPDVLLREKSRKINYQGQARCGRGEYWCQAKFVPIFEVQSAPRDRGHQTPYPALRAGFDHTRDESAP